jgi:hypothetical protein
MTKEKSIKKNLAKEKAQSGRPKKTKVNSQSVLENLPDIYSKLAFKTFYFKGARIIIKVRCKNIETKPPLFLWNLTTNTYLSSLFRAENNSFFFDILEDEQAKKFNLIIDQGTIQIKEDVFTLPEPEINLLFVPDLKL